MMRRIPLLRTAKHPYEHYTSVLGKGVGRSMNVFMDKGEGSYMYDKDGKKYLDYTCGIGVVGLGHCHPRLVKVVQKQATQLWHGMVAFGVSTAVADLVDEMNTILPPELNHLFFCTTGSEAVEAALRAARTYTKRQNVVVLQGGYHGRTNACLAMTTSKYGYHINCRPTMPGVIVVPPPFSTQLHVPADTPQEEMTRRCVEILKDLIFQQSHPSEIAMLIAEPVMGEGAYLPLPGPYLKALRQVCDEHGIVFCLDEVQSGFGRTGSFFNFMQTEGIVPDIVTFAKGVANGIPLAGIAMTEQVNAGAIVGTQGGTYAGNPISCACAAEVVRIMKEEGIFENCVARGLQMFNGLEKMITERGNLPIMEIRGRGLMIGLQFTDDAPAGIATEVMNQCVERGLMVLSTSKYEVLRFIPPLNTTEEEVRTALAIFDESLMEALAAKGYDAKNAKPIKSFKPCCDKQCFKLKGWDKACRRIAQTE